MRLATTLLPLCGIAVIACSSSSRPELNGTELADSVRVAFQHAWSGDMRYARGHDELRPLSNGFRDWHDESLYMTPLDAFDTVLLMGLNAEAAEAKQLVLDNFNFDHDFSVQVFEIPIRTLGGLISGYQMDGDPRFLTLATDLADRLLPAFESRTGMPYGRVHLQTGETGGVCPTRQRSRH